MIEKLSNITSTGAPDKRKIDREKTEGEKKFDLAVYGGIGWVANAVISACVTFALYRVEKVSKGFESHVVQPLLRMKPSWLGEKALRDGIFGTTLCSGGTLLVPVMKYYEDKKSQIVRKWDEEIYGRERSHTDQHIVQAHIDMDNAPKQSWLSMWGARAAVIGIAFGMGKTIGAHDSMLGKATDHIPILRNVSTFERIGAATTRTIAKASDWVTLDLFKMKNTPWMDRSIAKAHPVKIQNQEHNALHAGEIIGYELTQSFSIALIFYGISKAISSVFHRPEASPRHIPTTVTLDAAARRQKDSAEPVEKPLPEPENTVSSVTHEAKVERTSGKSDPGVAA
jgi:hypothetical protein